MVLISLVPALTPLYLYFSTFRSMCAVPNMAAAVVIIVITITTTTTTIASTIVSFIIIFLTVVSEPTKNPGTFRERATDCFWPNKGS